MSAVSIFDIFKVGIGPSSSHTVGPMKAAGEFARQLASVSEPVSRIEVTLYGSLAFTGKGHGTDSAVILGLMGLTPETIDPDDVENTLRKVHREKLIEMPGAEYFSPHIAVFEDGRRIVSTSLDGQIRIWHVRTGLCPDVTPVQLWPDEGKTEPKAGPGRHNPGPSSRTGL